MNLELKNQEEKELAKKQLKAYKDLNNFQQCAVVSLALSNSVRQACQKFKAMTGRSDSFFWSYVYPEVKETWQEMARDINTLAFVRAQALGMKSVDELGELMDHYDPEIRLKSAKTIFENVVVPKKDSGGGGNTFNAPVQFNFDKYKK